MVLAGSGDGTPRRTGVRGEIHLPSEVPLPMAYPFVWATCESRGWSLGTDDTDVVTRLPILKESRKVPQGSFMATFGQ